MWLLIVESSSIDLLVLSDRLSAVEHTSDMIVNILKYLDLSHRPADHANESVEIEAQHFSELFGHLKVSYIEEDSREKYDPHGQYLYSPNMLTG